MKTWIVTGYSGKHDGILVAVEAEDIEGALAKAASSLGLYHTTMADDSSIFWHPDSSLQEHLDAYESEGPRWCWSVAAQQLELGKNLVDAVVW